MAFQHVRPPTLKATGFLEDRLVAPPHRLRQAHRIGACEQANFCHGEPFHANDADPIEPQSDLGGRTDWRVRVGGRQGTSPFAACSILARYAAVSAGSLSPKIARIQWPSVLFGKTIRLRPYWSASSVAHFRRSLTPSA